MTLAHATLTVDLTALVANYRSLTQRHAKNACAAVVKADAYGLGMEQVAKALQSVGCRTFFVATLEEGIALRRVLSSPSPYPSPRRVRRSLGEGGRGEGSEREALAGEGVIYIFESFFPGEEKELLAHNLRPVLNHAEQAQRWKKAVNTDNRQRITDNGAAALMVDTGMHRLGLSEKELQQAGAPDTLIKECNLTLLMSHLACASEPEHSLNEEQRRRFDAIRKRFPNIPASLANSAGHFLDASYHYDMGRPGCSLYGITPNRSLPNPMRHVATLKGPVIQIRDIEKDGHIGYGATAEVKKGTRVAVVALGYADGVHRVASNKLPGFVGGREVPMLGRVSMDMTCFDVSDVPSQLLEKEPYVTLIGPEQPVDTVAEICHTIGYEIFTRIGSRVTRVYT